MDNKKKIRVLVADDHPALRDGFCRLLEDEEDFVVVGKAGTCEQTVALATELKPDVAIIDVSMPGCTGIEATKRIKQILPNVMVLMVSAYDYESFILESLHAGASGYLLKSTPFQELASAIRMVHLGKIVLDRALAGDALQQITVKTGDKESTHNKLHSRELEILQLVAKGASNKEIAAQLVISERTVESHVNHILRKLGARSRTPAVISAIKKGWLSIDEMS
jgi:DNA-binding NarL/FixJ family response regulator